VFSGPLAEQLRRQPDCAHGQPSVDVYGNVIAYLNRCAGGAVVRDFSAPRTAPVMAFPADHSVRVAGRYLAADADTPKHPDGYPHAGRIRVYDRITGELVYVVEAPMVTFPAFDIDVDGTLAFSRDVGNRDYHVEELAIASPAQPVPRTVRQWVYPGTVRIKGDRIAVLDPFGLHVFDPYGYAIAETEPADLAGDGFDFDGRRLAWSVHPCEVTAIVVWDLAGAPPALSKAPCPQPRVVRVEQRERALAVVLRCDDPEGLGCWGEVKLRLPGGAKRKRVYAVRPGRTETARPRELSRTTACALAAERRPHATVTTTVYAYQFRRADPVTRRVKVGVVERPHDCP
jgi:hypothetical protein